MPDQAKIIAMRAELVAEQDGKCAYCERPFGAENGFRRPTLDHIVPLAMGGHRFSKTNLVAACAECNAAKGEMDAQEFKANLQSNMEQAESLKQALRRAVSAIGEGEGGSGEA